MKISKWVDFEQEVDIEISAADVTAALSEAFANVTTDRLPEEDRPNRHDVTRALNAIARFLNGMTDEHIAKLDPAQRKVTREFLLAASQRF